MSVNLVEQANEALNASIVKQVSALLGESEAGILKAFSCIVPSLFAGVVEQSRGAGSAQILMDRLSKIDVELTGNVSVLFQKPINQTGISGSSNSGLLEALLGSKTGAVIDFTANRAGLRISSATTLSKMTAPLILGLVSRQIKGNGIDFLSDFLESQSPNIKNSMPQGLDQVMGFFLVPDVKYDNEHFEDKPPSNKNLKNDRSKIGQGYLSWILPILIGGAIIYWVVGKGCGKQVDETINEGRVIEDSSVISEQDGVKIADSIRVRFQEFSEGAKLELEKFNFTSGSAGQKMKSYIDNNFVGSPVFRFEHLDFASGSSFLDDSARVEINEIAVILNVYTGVSIEISGHTDNVGDPVSNKELSQARATAVMNRLVELGVEMDRLSAVGYGEEKPLASNNTEEGRAQNRRTEIRILEK